MDANAPRGLLGCFDKLEDPRMDRTRRHRLDDIIALAILATVCGADRWTEIEMFGQTKHDWLKTFLHLPNGIPSHDTLGRVFAALDPDQFEACFLQWVEGLVDASGLKSLHIDGKTLRRSFDSASNRSAIHMVSAWASRANLALGQLATDDKSNEITAIPKLLEWIDLHETVVTIDAMGTQRDIAHKIIQGGGDYILAVKQNQPTLYEDVKLLMDDAIEIGFEHMGYDFDQQADSGHGRIETRRVWVTREVDWLRERGQWKGLRGAICVESVRQVIGEEPTIERRYFITSIDHRERGKDAAFFAGHIREHWGIENKLHWSLDVAFDEDQARVRQGHAAENLSRLRRFALNLLKQETTLKAGLAAKRLRAGWDHDYLLKIFGLNN